MQGKQNLLGLEEMLTADAFAWRRNLLRCTDFLATRTKVVSEESINALPISAANKRELKTILSKRFIGALVVLPNGELCAYIADKLDLTMFSYSVRLQCRGTVSVELWNSWCLWPQEGYSLWSSVKGVTRANPRNWGGELISGSGVRFDKSAVSSFVWGKLIRSNPTKRSSLNALGLEMIVVGKTFNADECAELIKEYIRVKTPTRGWA